MKVVPVAPLLAALAVGLTLSVKGGWWSWLGFVFVLAGAGLVVVHALRDSHAMPPAAVLWPCLVLSVVNAFLGFQFVGSLWPGRHGALGMASLLAWIVLLLVVGWLRFGRRDEGRLVVVAYRVLVLVGFALVAVFSIHWTTTEVDVFHYQTEAASRILAGEPLNGEPYYQLDDSWYAENYPYLPLEAMLRAPFQLLGDVRYAGAYYLLASYPILAILGRRAGWSLADSELAATCALVVGSPLYMLQNAWTEVLVPPFLAGGVLALLAGGRRSAGVLLGLAAALKLYLLVLVPAAWSVDRRTGIWAAGTATATVLPFAFQDLAGLVDGSLLFHFGYVTRLDGLNFVHLWPDWPIVVGWIAWAAVVAVLVVRRVDLHGALVLVAVALFAMFLMGKQGNPNYYYVLAPLLLVAGITPTTPKAVVDHPAVAEVPA